MQKMAKKEKPQTNGKTVSFMPLQRLMWGLILLSHAGTGARGVSRGAALMLAALLLLTSTSFARRLPPEKETIDCLTEPTIANVVEEGIEGTGQVDSSLGEEQEPRIEVGIRGEGVVDEEAAQRQRGDGRRHHHTHQNHHVSLCINEQGKAYPNLIFNIC